MCKELTAIVLMFCPNELSGKSPVVDFSDKVNKAGGVKSTRYHDYERHEFESGCAIITRGFRDKFYIDIGIHRDEIEKARDNQKKHLMVCRVFSIMRIKLSKKDKDRLKYSISPAEIVPDEVYKRLW